MSIIFDPTNLLKKVAPVSKIKRMVSNRLGLKRTILSHLDTKIFPIDKKSVANVAIKTLEGYKERIAKTVAESNFERKAGDEEKSEILDDPKQLINRVQNEIVFQAHERIKANYAGQRARWLPSDADDPRPLHQKFYGQEYTIGEGLPAGEDGEMVEPGDEYGCKCGVEILTNETQLDLS